MLSFIAGTAAGFAILYVAEVWRGRRISRRQKRQMALFAEMQRAIFDVQDAVAVGLHQDTCAALRADRDRAADAYFAALGE